MRLPDNLLNLLIENDAFRVSRIMPEQEFIRFCEARGVRISRERLRQFERIGVFRPLLRTYQPDITYKIETVGDSFHYLGELEPGEAWEGETRIEMARFSPETRYARDWRDEGFLWVP